MKQHYCSDQYSVSHLRRGLVEGGRGLAGGGRGRAVVRSGRGAVQGPVTCNDQVRSVKRESRLCTV